MPERRCRSSEDWSHSASCSLPVQPTRGRNVGGDVCVCLLMLVWKKTNKNKMMTGRWPPNRCSTNVCTGPAVRVEKMAEWILFPYKNTQTCCQLFTPVWVRFWEFTQWAPVLSTAERISTGCLCFCFLYPQVYSGLARCFFLMPRQSVKQDTQTSVEYVSKHSTGNAFVARIPRIKVDFWQRRDSGRNIKLYL